MTNKKKELKKFRRETRKFSILLNLLSKENVEGSYVSTSNWITERNLKEKKRLLLFYVYIFENKAKKTIS